MFSFTKRFSRLETTRRGTSLAEQKRQRRRFQSLERLEERTLLAFTPILTPTVPYTTGTINLSAAIPANGVSTGSITDGTETITLSSNAVAQTVPNGTFTAPWGVAGNVENTANPRILTELGQTSVTL